MQRRTVKIAVVSSASLCLFGIAAPTATASATASATITATASSPASNVGQLELNFTAPSAITGFTVHVLTAHGTDVLDIPMSGFSPDNSGTWIITKNLSTSQLVLGSYGISVDAQDASGDSVTGYLAGTVNFQVEPAVTLSASPARLTYLNPTATLSGIVTGLWPDGSSGPLAGRSVSIAGSTVSGSYNVTAVTDGSGDFSVTLPQTYGGTFTASIQGSDIVSATSPPVTVNATWVPTRLAITVTPTSARYGQKVTVQGTLTYKPGSSYIPLPSVAVDISDYGSPAAFSQVTDAEGRFSASFTLLGPSSVNVTFNAVESADGNYPLLLSAQASVPLKYSTPTTISQFSASLNPEGQLSVQGCLGLDGISPQSATYLDTAPVIQYATSPRGPWHRLGGAQLQDYNGTIACSPTQAEAIFSATLNVKLARAYYRAYFPGQPGQGYLASAGTAVLAWKYPTRISSLHASATSVRPAGWVTFTGRLLQEAPGWKPYEHQTVLVVYRKPGSTTWHWITKTTTTSSGAFRVNVKVPFTAYWSVFFGGDRTHFNCLGPAIKITVS